MGKQDNGMFADVRRSIALGSSKMLSAGSARLGHAEAKADIILDFWQILFWTLTTSSGTKLAFSPYGREVIIFYRSTQFDCAKHAQSDLPNMHKLHWFLNRGSLPNNVGLSDVTYQSKWPIDTWESINRYCLTYVPITTSHCHVVQKNVELII